MAAGSSSLGQSVSLLVPALRRDVPSRAIERVMERISGLPVQALVVYDFDNVDASALAHLAEQFGILELGWELASSEDAQRAMLKFAIKLQRHRGTVWAIREVFRLLNLGEIDIEEGRSGRLRDGSVRRDGYAIRGDGVAGWNEYRVRCHKLLTIKQADAARRMLANMAPARCRLYEIDFSDAALVRNGFARRDGTYSRGSA